MNLHSNQELLQDAIQATAEMLGIREIYVEKDYWVTVALYEIFHSDIASEVVFKGGTALSKCFKLIERFSEDIDLVVLRNTGENDNQLKKKIRAVSKVVEKVLPEIAVEGLTNKRGNIRKTVHQYDKIYDGNFGQVREQVILEATWLGNFEPYTSMPVSCYISEMMQAKGQEELIKQYNMAPFDIQVLGKTRTFCEKVMGLVRFSRSPDPINDLRNKIRHVYDLHQMLKDAEVMSFFNSSDFDEMLIKVGRDDMVGYKNNNDWIPEHPAAAMIFARPNDTWKQLSTTYNTSFRELVTGELPPEEALVVTLKMVEERLQQVAWNIG
ncbi:nucleotidyl transferase AbiEii/AbiGii toxin family protein [Tunicatimonas pelagia]|uniref:nucleotidyl transferase AbiEii/AbiGii toxin family protein n=1 Tax=Tunicatimonas pelagia TaxID=931531 RepID=UPI00266544C6|nr:nucleotidyl transferase AbiEii/AbiGii toxin family protein [Tunicatimonas pelagia]WKN44899.1 nucleotidyl transferase AbiEii/AbiGii toxin family protein [Tunicatimonas pelagia]